MSTSKRKIVIGILLLLIMGGSGLMINYFSAGLAYAESDAAASNVDALLVDANIGFAVRLLRELMTSQSGGNIFVSPLSVSVALTMAYDGADTTTMESMAKTLGIDSLSAEEVNLGYRNLIKSLMGVDRDVTLNIGDSVWIRDTSAQSIKTTFTDDLYQYFLSDVYTGPFDASTTADVNSWVSKETSGKIAKIVDQIDQGTVMFLINAVYFKGSWVDKFDASLTHMEDFTTSKGSIVQVEMMSRQGDFDYYLDDEVQIVRLPYGRDKIAMYVFLPSEGSSLEEYTSSLTGNSLNAYFSLLSERELSLQMPKLKLEYGKVDLKDTLTNMGMGVAFDPNAADFNGIADVAPQRLYIQFIDHKAVVEVNEEGTEAAAATNVGIGVTSIPTTTRFTVDRPYMFVIRDDRSGSILFFGLTNDPTMEASP